MAASTAASIISPGFVLGVEAPNTEEEAGEHRTADDGQQEHRKSFLDREGSQNAHTLRVALRGATGWSSADVGDNRTGGRGRGAHPSQASGSTGGRRPDVGFAER